MAIKNIVFDLGGVVIELDRDQAVRRFEQIGVEEAEQLIDPYEQKDIFLEVENGAIDVETFHRKLQEHTGKTLSFEEIIWAWMGFVKEVPQYKLDYILRLRENYNVYLLSNTNPIIQQQWAQTDRFTPAGKPLNHYFDKLYTSYEAGVTKPDIRIFQHMLNDSGMFPFETLFIDDAKVNIEVGASLGMLTYQPENGEDWRPAINRLLAAT